MFTNERFNLMLVDPNIQVQEFAKRAQEIKGYWTSKQISKSEYDELIEDLYELKTVNKEMLSLDAQRKIKEFCDYLKNVGYFMAML
jgi:hypothetical protein